MKPTIRALLLATLIAATGGVPLNASGTSGGVTQYADGSLATAEYTEDSEGGSTQLKLLTTGDDKVKIKDVWRWDPWTESWDKITDSCSYPADYADDPSITLPQATGSGEKIKVRFTAQDGGDTNSTCGASHDFLT